MQNKMLSAENKRKRKGEDLTIKEPKRFKPNIPGIIMPIYLKYSNGTDVPADAQIRYEGQFSTRRKYFVKNIDGTETQVKTLYAYHEDNRKKKNLIVRKPKCPEKEVLPNRPHGENSESL